MNNDINELSEAIFKNASQKGFWDEYNLIMDKLNNGYQTNGDRTFTDKEIDSIKFAFSCQRMMLIVSELGEAVEAKRTGKKANWEAYQKVLDEKNVDFDAEAFKEFIKDSPEDELADSYIRHGDMAGGEGINLGKHVEHKMKYNTTRPRLHGKEF